jgi:hypothetical protein
MTSYLLSTGTLPLTLHQITLAASEMKYTDGHHNLPIMGSLYTLKKYSYKKAQEVTQNFRSLVT